MSTFTVYAQETGKTVTLAPESHLYVDYLIRRIEGAGRHVAFLMYDHTECIECGTEEGATLNRHADGELYMLCPRCHEG